MNRLRLVNRVLLQEEANTTFLDDAPTPSPAHATLLPTPYPTPLSQLFPNPTRPATPTYSEQDNSNDGGTVFIAIFIVVLVVGVFAVYVNFRSSGENETGAFHSHLA
jgi:hypothetical protein